MDIQGALAGIAVYNSMTAYPLIGLKGLAIYLQENKTGDQIERMNEYLRTFRDQFAKVVLSYGDKDEEAMLKNISVYEGIEQLFKDNANLRNEIVSNIRPLVDLIEHILSGENPHRSDVESSAPFLMRLIEQSERSLQKSRYENYLLGHPAVGY